ncbi:hypothetical protein [Pelagibius sp. Alg239-R121]|uniref:hypothetical protein n=1 Tax=Pelagibius sp. Alg239-R121 TaxID=2993448 RepID=UPI0024A6AE1B|nr:hypothetical protein [Pelagibius sp. Alg239-R121]
MKEIVALGGWGSGPTLHPKQTVDDTPEISVFNLNEAGAFDRFGTTKGEAAIGWGQCIAFEAHMYGEGNSKIYLRYGLNGQSMMDIVLLDSTPCHYGGVRWWFICPDSGERAGKLFLAGSPPYFASRKAHNLTYRSCQDSGKISPIMKLFMSISDAEPTMLKAALKQEGLV